MTSDASSTPAAAAPMDLATAAAYAGVTIAELARAIHRREIAIRVGGAGALYVHRATLDSWAAHRTTQS